jgi:hypothetical protein
MFSHSPSFTLSPSGISLSVYLMIHVSQLFVTFYKTCLPHMSTYTVIRFRWVSAKFGTCTVVSANGTFVEDKMRRFKGERAHFSFNKCPSYTHDGANTKIRTNSHEPDYSVPIQHPPCLLTSTHSVLTDCCFSNLQQYSTVFAALSNLKMFVCPLFTKQ